MNNNLPTQNEFLAMFPNTRYRYIHDVNKTSIQGNNILDLSWNKKGYGIFFTVNGFPSTGSAEKEHILSLNCSYIDFDVDVGLSHEEKDRLIKETLMLGIEAGIPTPTIINRTQKGAHIIWLYPEILIPTPENLNKWKDVQERLVHFYKGDKNAKDITRVLRVPYTLHLKDPQNPFEIKIISYKPEMKCTLNELDLLLPKYPEKETSNNKIPVKEILFNGVEVGKGLRHMAMAQVAGLVLKNVKTAEDVEIARLALYGWDRCIVKSPESFERRKKELDTTIDGVLKCEVNGRNENVKPLQIWSISDILKHDFGVEEWFVESLISKQGITALSGNPGDFKTWVTIHIALCLSRNIPVFGKFKVTQGNVLVIDEEDHMRLLKKRLELLGAKDTDNIYYLSQNGIKMDDEIVSNNILEIVKGKNIKLLILDSLVRVHNQEENDAKGMAKVFSSLQKIIHAGASILFTHHHRKQIGFSHGNLGQSMRGSSDILAVVDCHITIEKKHDEKGHLIIKQTKLRQAELLPPFEVKILKSELGPSGFEYIGNYDEKKKKALEVAEVLTSVLSDGMKNRIEIIEILKGEFGKTAVEDGIKLAEESKHVERVPKDELLKKDIRKAFYRLPNIDTEKLSASLPLIIDGKQEVIESSSNSDEWF